MTTPLACTLPSDERPLRTAEFTSLFAQHLVRVAWIDDRSAVFHLVGDPGLADRVRDLTNRESRCCAFFTFTVEQSAAGVVNLGLRVPRRHRAVLRAMADSAARTPR